MATYWATNLLHFHLNKLFKNMVCIVALFGLATVLATFQKIWPIFPPIFWSPWYHTHSTQVVLFYYDKVTRVKCFFFLVMRVPGRGPEHRESE
jgi:hypothetical protein